MISGSYGFKILERVVLRINATLFVQRVTATDNIKKLVNIPPQFRLI